MICETTRKIICATNETRNTKIKKIKNNEKIEKMKIAELLKAKKNN